MTRLSNIVPSADGVLDLEPTMILRWADDGKTRKLQQLWRDRETKRPYWRNIPVETVKP